MSDNVNRPRHYQGDAVECIEAIEACCGHVEDHYRGTIMKYVWRAGRKTLNPVEDLKKARWYLERWINSVELAEAAEAEADKAFGPIYKYEQDLEREYRKRPIEWEDEK